MKLHLPKTIAIRRDAFLYLDPKPPENQFAQCGTCMMFTGSTCTIHGLDVPITKRHSCGLYVHGKPMPNEKGHEMASVTPEESGLIEAHVRCKNCRFFQAEKSWCGLYERMSAGGVFQLNAAVHPNGCCNAWSGG